jgi:uncharacterized protein
VDVRSGVATGVQAPRDPETMCPPTPRATPIERILGYARRIAVVGLSPDPRRTSHGVAAALQREGYEIVPVNPNADEVLGERPTRALRRPGQIDLVDVFRREEHLEDVARQAAERGGVDGRVEPARAALAGGARARRGAGLDYVEDRCLKVEVAKARTEMTLPPPAA